MRRAHDTIIIIIIIGRGSEFDSARALAPQSSHRKFPSALVGGGPVAPPRNLPPHAPHRVAGPRGPGFLPLHSSALHKHQSHFQLPPSQRRV
jgi:hypothetical protein